MTDSTSKNILHHAVIGNQRDLVQRIIYLDSDQGHLRKAKDAKGYTPAQYDTNRQYKDLFSTVWDQAKEGNVERVKAMLAVGGKE